jgi:rubrerythrin
MQSPFRLMHRWIWRDPHRRAHKLLRFAETEADGGRDLVRAAERTADPLLRRLYLTHADDEQRHANLFRHRGIALLRALPASPSNNFQANWFAPGERGLDELRVEREPDEALLAFLHLSEKAAAQRFAIYRDVLANDPPTRELFAEVLHDETFHMRYTLSQLSRLSPERSQWLLWRARLGRLWKGYLRIAVALADVFGTVFLIIQYFVFLPPFALLAKRAARREKPGWSLISDKRNGPLNREY